MTSADKWITNLRLYIDANRIAQENQVDALSDNDIAGRLSEDAEDISEEADRRRTNQLRQIRHRIDK